MGALDSLPPDQRAVLQLVLQRGRSYDEIAEMLSIDRAAVRQRALDGFDALGPETSVPAGQRAVLTDYLLGQLPPRVAEQTLQRLGDAPAQRAWARVIAGEIAQVSIHPLPEIPVGSTRPRPEEEADRPRLHRARERAPLTVTRASAPDREAESTAPPADGRAAVDAGSRRSGAILLGGVAAVIIVAVVVVVLVTSGGSKPRSTASGSTSSADRGGGTTSSPTTTTSTTASADPLAQANLYTSAGPSDKTETGVGEFLKAGGVVGVVVIADGLPADSNASKGVYGIWLLNPGGTSKFLGFPDTKVGTNGKLETEGQLSTALQSSWTQYKDLAITLETSKNPTTPGHIVLEGTITKAAANTSTNTNTNTTATGG